MSDGTSQTKPKGRAVARREPDFTRMARKLVDERWLHHAQGCRVCRLGTLDHFHGPIAPDCPDGRKLYQEWHRLWRQRKPVHHG